MRETVLTHDVDDTGLRRLLTPRDDFVLESDEGGGRFGCAEGPFRAYERTVEATPAGAGRHHVVETTRWDLAIPLWGRLFRPMVHRMLRRGDRLALESDEPAPSPWWAPPARLDARASRILSLLCGMSMLAGYLGTTISQTITFAADEFGASTADQGTTLAAVRVGVLLSLVLMALADRKGRRRLLMVSAVGATLAAAVGALSPNLAFLGVTQTFSRAFSTALAVLITVIAAEEMPAGGRAYAASVLAMTAALGAGGAVLLLPLADLAEPAWRVIYVVPLLALPAFRAVGTRIPESKRFVRPHARASMAGHRGRLALLAVSGFLGLMFVAPVSQLQNEYLRDEHGFSALQLTIFTISTNTPGGIGVIIGGRLADVRGRRLVGAFGTLSGAILYTATYQVSGPWIWLTTVTAAVLAATTVPALGVYGPELFPTSLRGRANGWITLAGVLGSSVGLTVAGRLADEYGRIGPGIAVLAIGPLVLTGLVLLLYPETAHLELEELNPEDAVGTASVPVPLQ